MATVIPLLLEIGESTISSSKVLQSLEDDLPRDLTETCKKADWPDAGSTLWRISCLRDAGNRRKSPRRRKAFFYTGINDTKEVRD